MTHPPCGHPWDKAPVEGCAICSIRHVPFHKERWGGTGAPEFPRPRSRQENCRYLGEPTGELIECEECSGKVQLKLFVCEIHGKCTIAKQADEIQCCANCPQWSPKDPPPLTPKLENPMWAVGITTVTQRKDTYLPRTLDSLRRAGFPKPRLFVDGGHPDSYNSDYEVTPREPKIGPFGNFALGLWELVMRNPSFNRFAMFQDDAVCCTNLRAYLDSCRYPVKGYWNLFTYSKSERVIQGKTGWIEGGLVKEDGEDPNRFQKGQGALGLVFDRETALILLEQPPFIRKPVSAERPTTCVDGAVVGGMNHAGYREFVHGPSLVQHIGIDSSVQEGKKWLTYAGSFKGEEWDPNIDPSLRKVPQLAANG